LVNNKPAKLKAAMDTENSKKLTDIRNGQTVVLVGIEGGYGLKNRLSSMGLVPDVQLTVINNGHPGPFLISVKGTKTIIGKGVANKIVVKYT
jgi:Fe2+ transport system protein FeoA